MFVLESGAARRFRVHQGLEGRPLGQSGLSQDGAKFQSGDGHGGRLRDRRSRGAGRAGRDSAGSGAHAGHFRECAFSRASDYEKRIEKRTVRKRASDANQCCADGAWKNAGQSRTDKRELIARRVAQELRDGYLRESRHRHADAGRQLHSRGDGSRAAIGKRHARRRPVSLRGRGRPGPDQRRQGNGHGNSRHQLFFERRFLRHDSRRAREHDRAGRAAGG